MNSRPWFVAVVLGATNCLAFSDRALMALLAPAMKASLMLSDLMIGLLLGTAFVLPYVVGTIIFPVMVDQVGRLRAIMLSLSVWTGATLLCGLAQSTAALFAARMLLGLGQAPLTPAAATYLATALPAHQLGRATSVFTMGATLGRSLALLGGGVVLAWIGIPLLGHSEGWRAVFAVAVIPGSLLAILLLVLQERPSSPAPSRASGQTLGPWLRRHWRPHASHTVASAAAVLVIQTLTAWATTVLVRRHGLTVAAAGSLFGTIVLVCAPLGHLCGGALLDLLGRRVGARASGTMIAGSLVLGLPVVALFGLATQLELAWLSLTIASFVLGLGSPAGLVGIQVITPPELRARATALFMACVTTAGFGLGPPAVGALTDHLFGEAGIGEALVLVSGCATVIGLLAVALGSGRKIGTAVELT